MLTGRPYTLFSGHHHNYLFDNHSGNKHFVLGTTGGGSKLRGPEYGEFDHIVWVTMKENGPLIANIKLNGIISENIVSRESYPMVESLRSGNWLRFDPVVLHTARFDTVSTIVHLKNTTDQPLKVTGELSNTDGISFKPSQIDETIPSNTQKDIKLIMENESENKLVSDFQKSIKIQLIGSYPGKDSKILSLPAEAEILMDWLHPLQQVVQKINIDGNPDDWDVLDFIDVKYPQYIKEDWDWKGVNDGWYRFALAEDDQHLYIFSEAIDDKLILFSDKIRDQQDKFFIQIAALDQSQESLEFEIAPDDKNHRTLISPDNKGLQNIKAIIKAEENLLIAEIAIPYSDYSFLEEQNFRFNIAFMDHDNPNNIKPSILWWRPQWGQVDNYQQAGLFYREGTK